MANASCSNCTLISNVLTLVGSVSGTVLVGMTITGAGVPAAVTVTSYGTGTGQAGTYNCSSSVANVTTGEPMVFSLSWSYPLQGNSRWPQLADLGRASGFGLVIASSITGPSAGPGQEYHFGTHQVAIYNDTAVQGTNLWPVAPGHQGRSVVPTILTLPQFPEPIAPQVFTQSAIEKAAKYQPLAFVSAAPQGYDFTLQASVSVPSPTLNVAWTSEYQFGLHQKALYDSQAGGQIFPSVRTAVIGTPITQFMVPPQAVDFTIQGQVWVAPVETGWLVTNISAGPQEVDLTLQSTLTPAQPFHSTATPLPFQPQFVKSVAQDDPTQIPARTFAPPPLKPPYLSPKPVFASPIPWDPTQVQGAIFPAAVPPPAKYVQPAYVWAFEQQYDKNCYPQLTVSPTIQGPAPPPAGFRVVAVTAGVYQNVFRTPGDVFDLALASDFSDSGIDYQPPSSGTVGYGWMAKVAPATPLFNWLESNGYPAFPPQDPLRRFVY